MTTTTSFDPSYNTLDQHRDLKKLTGPNEQDEHIVLLLPPDEGSFGNYTPEYQLSSRVATSQLKEPRVMKVDMRSEY